MRSNAHKWECYGETQPLFLPYRADTWRLFERQFGPRADKHVRDGGNGKLGWFFVFGDERRAADDLGVGANDPHVAGTLDVHVSWKRILGRYPAKRATRRG